MQNLPRNIGAFSRIVTEGGNLVKDMLARGVKATVKENQPGGSHHSIGTEADEQNQTFMLSMFRLEFPGARFLAEEECEGRDLIQNNNLALVKEGRVIIIDSVDGTAGAYRQRWDWSVCANLMVDGDHRSGAIYAPEVRGGFHIVGMRGAGALLREGGIDQEFKAVTVSERLPKKSTVLFGVDVRKRKQFMKFSNIVANAVETVVDAGSCALGVATVAAGRAEAIVQPHQWPWDWASATIIEAAGGQIIYYHYRDGTPVRLDQPDLASYNRSNRTTEGGLGFIAGASELVDWLWHQLQASWKK